MKQIAPGLDRLSGFPPNAVNVYLAGDVLIDAGSRLDVGRIRRQVKDRDLSMVALTHAHPDHQGAAKAICTEHQIPLACHADDVAVMDGTVSPDEALAPHQRGTLMRMIIKLAGPPHEVGRTLNDGDEVGEFTVIHAPGHSPGEVIYFRESDRVAICGDVINTMDLITTLPKVQEPPKAFTTDIDENRRSIVKLAGLNPSIVCPGHGPPLRKIGKLEALADRFR